MLMYSQIAIFFVILQSVTTISDLIRAPGSNTSEQ